MCAFSSSMVTSQHSYQLGDRIQWGDNDNGRPELGYVVVDGISEDACPLCRLNGEWDIYAELEHDIVTGSSPGIADIADIADIGAEAYEGEGSQAGRGELAWRSQDLLQRLAGCGLASATDDCMRGGRERRIGDRIRYADRTRGWAGPRGPRCRSRRPGRARRRPSS